MQSFTKLYEYVIPKHYKINLTIDIFGRKFHGIISLSAQTKTCASSLKLHAKDLKIKKALVNTIPANVSYAANDEIVLDVPKLQTKDVTIVLEYSGHITDTMHGLYPSYYEIDGVKKELLSTQLEAHHARELFPCIDEPSAKATFDLTLNTEAGVTVLGNMPITSQKEVAEQLVTHFETTPIMSTYLLAFVIGELQSVTKKTKNGVDIAVWSTLAHSKKDLEFACNTAKRCVEFFDDYFETPYPLPKADYVAIPDFSSGAMENWGLMTYREVCLVVNDQNSAISMKQQAATVIAHETAHQWFGNLVTMKWWDDLWLNESFANMMEYVAIDHLFPEWKIWEEFAAHESLVAKRRDALPGVQPVKIAVNHPDEINTLFDPAIVYAKGGNLLYMLKSFIGDTAFIEGLKLYFKRHAYENTTGDDLWKAWSEMSHYDVGAFMKPWLEQSGFPVVSVCQEETTLHLRQQHFRIGSGSDERIWNIPLFSLNLSLPELFDTKDVSVPFKKDFIKINSQDQGYFITHYDKELEKNLLHNLDNLSAIDRLQFLSDANLLSRAGMKPAISFFAILEAYQNEMSQPVWDLLAIMINDLKKFVEIDRQYEVAFKSYIARLIAPSFSRVGWDKHSDKDENTAKLRATLVALGIYSEDKPMIKQALDYYRTTSDIQTLDAELRSSIIAAHIKHGPKPLEESKVLMRYYQETSSSEIQIDIASGLTSTKNRELGQFLVDQLTQSDIIRAQDVPRWFAYLIRNSYLRPLAWQWLQDNWQWVEDKYKNDHHYDVFAYYAAASFNTESELAQFIDFFEPKKHEIALKRTITVGIDEIKARIAWLKKNQATVFTYLEQTQ